MASMDMPYRVFAAAHPRRPRFAQPVGSTGWSAPDHGFQLAGPRLGQHKLMLGHQEFGDCGIHVHEDRCFPATLVEADDRHREPTPSAASGVYRSKVHRAKRQTRGAMSPRLFRLNLGEI